MSVHLVTTKYSSISFICKNKIEKEGLPKDSPAGLGAGGPEFKSRRPDHFLNLAARAQKKLEPRLFSAGNDQLLVRVSTHAINRAGGAGANGVTEATRPLRDHGYGPIGSAHNRARRIEWRCGPEIHHDSGILTRSLPSDARTRVYADRGVLGEIRNIRSDGGVGPAAGSLNLQQTGRAG